MDNMLVDVCICYIFDNFNVKCVREKLVEQFCQLSGGGCVYIGDFMCEVYQGFKLSNVDFNVLVEDL